MIVSYLKKSLFYNVYHSLRYPKLRRLHKNQLLFFSKLIPPKNLCFDIGANIGSITSLLNKIKSTVIAVEPENSNFEILKKRFKKKKNIHLIKKAIDSNSSEKELFIYNNDGAFNTLSDKWRILLEDQNNNRWTKSRKYDQVITVQTTTLDHMIQEFGVPYYIKIDVEGFELNVIKGLSNVINLISIEANLPEFKEETIQCIELIFQLNKDYLFNITVDDCQSFLFKSWYPKNDITSFISETHLKYLEVFCKLSVNKKN